MKKNQTNAIQLFAILVVCSSILSACNKKTTTPPNPNENELITTCQINFVDSAGIQASKSFKYRDIDGDGGNNPSQWDTIRLKSNTTYFAEILLLDESKTPVDTISQEVAEEGQDHLFCFTTTGVTTQIVRKDQDVNGMGIGLLSSWKNGAISNGNVNIVLRHQPGLKTGSCDPGDTDIDLVFRTILE
ncbi:MAG: hypothetical protein KA198_03785 [Chitinophagaceae bacterium]|nr:hypothetical protein [Chitinophagaceae bacterium]